MKGKVTVTILVAIVIILAIVVGFLSGYFLTPSSREMQKPTGATTQTAGTQTITLTPAAVSATATTKPANIVYVTAFEGLNLRNKATTANSVILVIPFGAAVEVGGETEADGRTWYQCTYKGSTGYCAKEFTSPENPKTTYQNNKFYFKFDYPKAWEIKVDKAEAAGSDWHINIVGTTATQPSFDLWVNPSEMDFKEYTETVSEKSVIIGGVSTTKKILRNPSTNQIATLISFTYKSNTYFILYSYAKDKETTEQTLLDQILESWQFTK
jgi:uncharacterized protein YgiM (DUF1202 family)